MRLAPHVHIVETQYEEVVSVIFYSLTTGIQHAKPGHAQLASDLMISRGRRFCRKRVQEIIQGIGTLGFSAMLEYSELSLCCIPETLPVGMDVIEDLVFGDRLDESELARAMEHFLTARQSRRTTTAFAKMLQGCSEVLQARDSYDMVGDPSRTELKRLYQKTTEKFMLLVRSPKTCFDKVLQRLEKSPLLAADKEWESNKSIYTSANIGASDFQLGNSKVGQSSWICSAYKWFTVEQDVFYNSLLRVIPWMLHFYLFKNLREKESLCYEAGVITLHLRESAQESVSYLLATMETRNTGVKSDFDNVRDRLRRAVQEFAEKELNEENWEQAKFKLLFQLSEGDESTYASLSNLLTMSRWNRPPVLWDFKQVLRLNTFEQSRTMLKAAQELLLGHYHGDYSKR